MEKVSLKLELGKNGEITVLEGEAGVSFGISHIQSMVACISRDIGVIWANEDLGSRAIDFEVGQNTCFNKEDHGLNDLNELCSHNKDLAQFAEGVNTLLEKVAKWYKGLPEDEGVYEFPNFEI